MLQELHKTDRRHLGSNLGYISPVPQGQEYYSPSKVLVWQLQAMDGHRVYLQLSQIDLHNEDGKCSNYIEIRFNPCTPPMKICDNRVNSYTWATSQTRVQVRFVSDHSKPTNGTGFRGRYYYYPVNTSSESTNSLCSQHALCVQVLDASLCSTFTYTYPYETVFMRLYISCYAAISLPLPVEPCIRAPHLKSALPLVALSYLQIIGY